MLVTIITFIAYLSLGLHLIWGVRYAALVAGVCFLALAIVLFVQLVS
jgi:hypothetical protein